MNPAVSQRTGFAEADATAAALAREIQDALGNRFLGLALYGSLATGGFDPARSDIDVLVLTEGDLPPDLLPVLAALHGQLAAAGGLAARVEATYLPRRALRRYNPADPPRPYWNEGRFWLARCEADWVIQRHTLREQGLVIAGPPLRPLIEPIGPDNLRATAATLLRDRWAPLLDDPGRLRDLAYSAYAVLSVCRALHTLRHGTIATKPMAARWAATALDACWHPLIAWAATDPTDPAGADVEAAQAFIRYALTVASAAPSLDGGRG